MIKQLSLFEWVLGIQGTYYLITGLWPFLHLRSFETVTGPKDDIFLLHMTSALIIVIAGALLLSLRQEKTPPVLFLAVFSPVAFMFIEILYRSQINWTYFIDFAIQAVILAALVYSYVKSKKPEEVRQEVTGLTED